MEVYIIRHTPVAVGRSTCYGQLDVEVADTFLEDLQVYKDSLPFDTFDAVYCSPLSRCRKLAAALNIEAPKISPQIQELNFGDWEGMLWKEIPAEKLNPWMENFVHRSPPNGESFQQLNDRCQHFLTQLLEEEHDKVLLITHAGVIRCIWAQLLSIPLSKLFKLPVGFGETLRIQLDKESSLCRILQKK
ncbi:MAG: alpha-ribazole phosphatase [Bacteroidota bacterium]